MAIFALLDQIHCIQGWEALAKAPWHRPFEKALRAGAYRVAHGLLALLLVAVIPVVQSAVAWEGDRKLFDFLPESYIFYAMELFILVAFMVFGAKDAVQVFWDPDDD